MAELADIIVIAIDNSSFSENAFHWYLDHLHKPGNKIILIHSIEMPTIPTRETWEQQSKAGLVKAKEVENKYLSVLNEQKIEAVVMVDIEKPGEYIVRISKEHKARWIIMGSRGQSLVRRTVLGSVSNYVLHHADCPVMIVPSK